MGPQVRLSLPAPYPASTPYGPTGHRFLGISIKVAMIASYKLQEFEGLCLGLLSPEDGDPGALCLPDAAVPGRPGPTTRAGECEVLREKASARRDHGSAREAVSLVAHQTL